LNRHSTPLANRFEYIRQALGIILEPTPPQLCARLDGVDIDCEGEQYFPPRKHSGNRGRRYREVGFYNINWQANRFHGADRAPACTRLCASSAREPVAFNDGCVDMYRMKFRSFFKNPGFHHQTDKKRDMTLRFDGKQGQGLFFQWDGEARFAFSPSGDPFTIHVRKILNIPVVIGHFFEEKIAGDPNNSRDVAFGFHGATPEERGRGVHRVLQSVRGELDSALNATKAEMRQAGLPCEAPCA